MKKFINKVIGLVLLSIPLWLSSWFIGLVINKTIVEGFLILVISILGIILILDLFVLLITIMDLGLKLYNGDSLGENKWLKF